MSAWKAWGERREEEKREREKGRRAEEGALEKSFYFVEENLDKSRETDFKKRGSRGGT